jgi:hypothetical protein
MDDLVSWESGNSIFPEPESYELVQESDALVGWESGGVVVPKSVGAERARE